MCGIVIILDPCLLSKRRRQQERQKLNSAYQRKNNFPRARHFFLHFFAVVREASNLLHRLYCPSENEWENGERTETGDDLLRMLTRGYKSNLSTGRWGNFERQKPFTYTYNSFLVGRKENSVRKAYPGCSFIGILPDQQITYLYFSYS